MVKMKTVKPSPGVIAFVDDLKATLGRHQHLSAEEMLAGTSQLVGNLMALQDCRKYTEADIITLVEKNIETGNVEAIRATLPMKERQ